MKTKIILILLSVTSLNASEFAKNHSNNLIAAGTAMLTAALTDNNFIIKKLSDHISRNEIIKFRQTNKDERGTAGVPNLDVRTNSALRKLQVFVGLTVFATTKYLLDKQKAI